METAIVPQQQHQKDVGLRLRRVIDLLGLKYVEAADIMGVTRQVLRNWMAGVAYPYPFALYRLCRARGVTFDYIFLGDWSGLPFHLAKTLDAELQASLEGARGSVRQEPENCQ